jgi:N-acetylmuramoyl-L-alanine amidase
MSSAVAPCVRANVFSLLRCRALVVVALASLTVLAGCPPKSRGGNSLQVEPAAAPPAAPSIPIERLAYSLGMRVSSSGQYLAAMSGAGNSLLLVGPPQPAALLNSQRLDEPGEIAQADGRLLVSPSLVQRLREHLRLVQGAPSYMPGAPAPAPMPEPPLPPPPLPPLPGGRVAGTVVIDAGHGGKDRGTYSVVVGEEKQLVLDVSRRIRDILQQRGVRVIMTRADDRFIELDDRAEIANRARADLFVAIHADNAPKNASAMGCTVYTARDASAGSELLARRLEAALRPAAIEDRGRRHADYKVLVLTKMPAALIELGFFSNRTEALRLTQSSYRQQLAQAIASGILSSLQAGR